MSRPIRAWIILSGVLLFLAPAPAVAYEPWLEPMGARGLGLGGAVIASGTGSDALIANPAAMSLVRSYIWENYYRYNNKAAGHNGMTALVDSFKNERLAAGLFTSMGAAEPEDAVTGTKLDEKLWRAGLALSLAFSEWLAIGVNGHYYNYELNGLPGGDVKEKFFTLDVGAIAKVGEMFSVGAVAYDLLSDHSDDRPYVFGAGVAARLFKNQLLLEVDGLIEGKKPWIRGGAEFFFAQGIVIRGGGSRREFLDQTFLSGGLGYITKGSSVEFSVQHQLDGDRATIVGLDLRFFIR
ncbi:MAG: hypothetical protein CVU59_02190 [Deltaproteobacteria bacterium HGW-Deltaproteobacteria-17]|nr:MAG: hypothetical protein CVU59_02190 [Deltaproteobacteria bacterium HGW-Deltaproteobacteria-17]